MSTLEPALVELARGQRWLLTTQQTHAAGMTPQSLMEAVRSKDLIHPARGLYAVGSEAQPGNVIEWHETLAFGASLLWDDATLTSSSAVRGHGVTVWGVDLSRVHLLRPIDRTVRVGPYRVRRWRGQPVTSTALGPAVELCHALAQLAVDHGIVAGVVSADVALREGRVSPEELTAAAEVLAPYRHGSRAMAMAALADGARESVGESRAAVALTIGGRILEPQVEIRDATGHLNGRVDFLVRGTNVIVEFDGRLKYDLGDPSVLWAEKKREDALRRRGYVVVRLTWADLERPRAAIAKVRSALAAA